MEKTRVVFGFDMETDIGSWTPFYEGLVHGTPVILDILKNNGVGATFFFTAHSAEKHPETVRAVREAGHEIGCHGLYHETIGDPLIDIPGVYPLLPEEIYPRLKLSTDIVERVAGVRPVSFRAPRLWGSSAMLRALEKLGYLTDASYPLFFHRKQLEPYHPDKNNWTEKGRMRILELPNFADLSMESRDPLGRDRDQWPLFRTEGAAAVMRHVDGHAAYCAERGAEPFLCFYFHPWEFHKMPEGLIHFGEGAVLPDPFIVKNCGGRAAAELDALIKALLARGAIFIRADGAAAQ